MGLKRSAGRFVGQYLDSGASQYGGMVAYSLFVSVIPLALGILAVFGLVARPRRPGTLGSLLIDAFPPELHAPVRDAIAGASEHVVTILIVSLAGLAWFSTGLFSTTGFALNQIHGWPHRRFWDQRLRGLQLAAALIGAVAIVVAFSIAVRLLDLPRWLLLLGVWLALTYVIAFLYRHAPSRKLRFNELLPGAASAALLIVLAGLGLTAAANLSFRLTADTQFFAQLFALAAWVYLIAQVILIGAVFNRFLERR